MRAFITGIAGSTLTRAERSFLAEAEPWGAIVFRRNVVDAPSLRRLVDDIRDALGRAAPVLVDQEGGRVQRLGPPHWPQYPPAATFAALYDRDRNLGLAAARLGARLIAADLVAVGIDVDCMPIADVPVAGADAVIGDRAFGANAETVAALAAAFADGLGAGGVLPVLKHIPGHGRATADSHKNLPVVTVDKATLEAADFRPFRALNALPLAMTAHVVFTAFDPVAPATTSVTIVRDVIRDSLGYRGLLMSDDLSMAALSGTLAERTRAAIGAGCDMVLHCNGEMPEMLAVAGEAPLLAGESARRAATALAAKRPPTPFDAVAGRAEFAAMLADVWQPAQGLA